MKKSLTLVLVIPCLLTSCNTGKVNVSDLHVPTFDTDERINIGAWSWTVKNVNDTQLQGLQCQIHRVIIFCLTALQDFFRLLTVS